MWRLVRCGVSGCRIPRCRYRISLRLARRRFRQLANVSRGGCGYDRAGHGSVPYLRRGTGTACQLRRGLWAPSPHSVGRSNGRIRNSAGPAFGDHYGRAKGEAENVARAIFPKVTIIRPTWTYGPRDRHGFPRLLQALRSDWVSIIGSGDNLLNIVHAEDLAHGAILAATHPQSSGEIYNMCSEGDVTQRQFLDSLCDALGLPRIRRRYSVRMAFLGGWLGEVIGKMIRLKRAPLISRYTVSRLARSNAYRIEKAPVNLGGLRK